MCLFKLHLKYHISKVGKIIFAIMIILIFSYFSLIPLSYAEVDTAISERLKKMRLRNAGKSLVPKCLESFSCQIAILLSQFESNEDASQCRGGNSTRCRARKWVKYHVGEVRGCLDDTLDDRKWELCRMGSSFL